ncbi:MAG: LysR family transcriptional regulator [Bacteriovoracaceae bacterium]
MAINLDDIKYFLKVSDSLNVTRASEQLGITQPALSYSLKRLEQELGGELLIRLKNGIQLTKLGEEFKERCHKIIFEWESAQKIFHNDGEGVKGEYKIAIHPSVALFSLDQFLPQVAAKFPLLNFKLIHGLSREMTEKVISWEADFGIVVNPIEHPDLTIRELYKDEVTIFGTKNCAKKLIMDPELAQTKFILKGLKKNSPKDYITTGSLEVVFNLASAGLGLGLLPSSIARANSSLKPLKDAPKFYDRICLIYRREKHKNEVSKFIFDTIVKNLSH